MIEKAFESIVEFITKTYSIETFHVYLMFLLFTILNIILSFLIKWKQSKELESYKAKFAKSTAIEIENFMIENKTKRSTRRLVFTLETFAIECSMIYFDVDLFLSSGGLDEDNNGNFMGRYYSRLPVLTDNLANINLENLEIDYVDEIHYISIHTIMAQSIIDFHRTELMGESAALNEYKKQICFIGFKALKVSEKIRSRYNMGEQKLKKVHSIKAFINEYNKWNSDGAYKDF